MRIKSFSCTALIVSLSLALTGCGSGTNSGTTGGTASPAVPILGASKSVVSKGVITGFGGGAVSAAQYAAGSGSIFVNGVEYKTAASDISISGDAGQTEGSLKIGMVAEVNGTISEDGQQGTAGQIVVDTGIAGPVAAVDAANGSMTVLGQKVAVDSNTVFEGAAGLGAIASPDMVEVSGLPDANGVVLASRVEKKTTPFVPNKTEVRVAGTVGATFGQSFTVGDLTVNSKQPVHGIDRHKVAEARGTISNPSGTLYASEVELKKNGLDNAEEHTRVHLQGFVTDFVSMASFKVSGTTVNAQNVTAKGIANNVKVSVAGTMSGDVLVASRIRILKNGPSDSGATPAPIDGAVLYASRCSLCHGPLATSNVKVPTVSSIQNAINGNLGGMGSLSTLTAAEVQAIANALAPVPAPPAPAPSPAPALIDGVALYTSKCSSCHGPLATSNKTGTTAARTQSAIDGNIGGMGYLSTLSAAEVQAIADALAPAPAPAPAPIDGAALYNTYCAACHKPLATSTKIGTTATRTQSAIDGNIGGMGYLSTLSATEVQAIVDALAPATATAPAPAPIDGVSLYNGNCASCHGPISGFRGRTATQIQSAINKNTGGMGYLTTLTSEQILAIANALK